MLTTTPIITLDGEPVAAATDAADAVTVADGSDAMMQLLSDMYAQQRNHTDMMVICCGLIIGILLCNLVRWWR